MCLFACTYNIFLCNIITNIGEIMPNTIIEKGSVLKDNTKERSIVLKRIIRDLMIIELDRSIWVIIESQEKLGNRWFTTSGMSDNSRMRSSRKGNRYIIKDLSMIRWIGEGQIAYFDSFFDFLKRASSIISLILKSKYFKHFFIVCASLMKLSEIIKNHHQWWKNLIRKWNEEKKCSEINISRLEKEYS